MKTLKALWLHINKLKRITVVVGKEKNGIKID